MNGPLRPGKAFPGEGDGLTKAPAPTGVFEFDLSVEVCAVPGRDGVGGEAMLEVKNRPGQVPALPCGKVALLRPHCMPLSTSPAIARPSPVAGRTLSGA